MWKAIKAHPFWATSISAVLFIATIWPALSHDTVPEFLAKITARLTVPTLYHVFVIGLGLVVAAFQVIVFLSVRKDRENEKLRRNQEIDSLKNALSQENILLASSREEVERLNSKIETLSVQNSIQFYQGRNHTRPSLTELMKRASVVWVATFEATNLRGQALLKGPIKRLIVLDPECLATDVFASVEGSNTTREGIRIDIQAAIEQAATNGVAVKTFKGILTPVIIGDPESGDGWAQIEPYLPWSVAHGRPSLIFNQRDYPECFQLLKDVFESMWTKSPRTIESPDRKSDKAEIKRLTDGTELLQAKLKTATESAAHSKESFDAFKMESESEKNKLKEEADKWITSIFDRKREIVELQKLNDALQEKLNWMEFIHEKTATVVRKLGRTPTVNVQYYTGQANLELAERVRDFFRRANWKTGMFKEVSSTDFQNPFEGKRIMLMTSDSTDLITAVHFIECANFFPPEQAMRASNGLGLDCDLLVTIFPKNFWDK